MKLLPCGILALSLCCAISVPVSHLSSNAYQTVVSEETIECDEENDLEIQPLLFTSLVVGLKSYETGVITGHVINDFTFLPTTVTVYLYLYSSLIQTADYSQMTLESSAYIYDLDQGQTLTTTASTNGQQKYWLVLAKYQCNGGAWRVMQSYLVLYDADGNFIEKYS